MVYGGVWAASGVFRFQIGFVKVWEGESGFVGIVHNGRCIIECCIGGHLLLETRRCVRYWQLVPICHQHIMYWYWFRVTSRIFFEYHFLVKSSYRDTKSRPFYLKAFWRLKTLAKHFSTKYFHGEIVIQYSKIGAWLGLTDFTCRVRFHFPNFRLEHYFESLQIIVKNWNVIPYLLILFLFFY